MSDRAALVLVATPIGNAEDLSERARLELSEADSVACEDTRRTGSLFARHGIAHDPFIVCNDHTEHHVADEIVNRIAAGQRVALVSDAGTPGVSDPGYRVVQAAIDAGLPVVAIPGPSAVLVAISVSGFATDRFCFEGFLARKGAERRTRIEGLRTEERTSVLFESPKRLPGTLADLEKTLGASRRIVVARELTKVYEQIWRGTLGEAIVAFEDAPRGEIVLVIEGAGPIEITDGHITDALSRELADGQTRRDAVDSVVLATGAKKRRVYDLALGIDG